MAGRRVLALLESRATYGYSKNVMLAMREVRELELLTLVTGMHLIPELGNSIDLIRADGFPVSATVPMAPRGEGRGAWSRAAGRAIQGFADAFEALAPDILVIFGDRAESFSACVAASYMALPVAHVQAGDKSGHIDDIARMALAKLAHIHLASCEDSVQRLRRLGEEEWRIHNVGAPQLDNIVGRDYAASSITIEGTVHDLSRPYILLVQHPVLVEREEAGRQVTAAVRACLGSGLPVFCVYPNSDLGYQDIVAVIETAGNGGRFIALRNLERDDYLTLLANAAVLVGNSSSGILEAPSFKIPVVNVGNRQRGRPQAANILNAGYDEAEIAAVITRALDDPEFQETRRGAVNPYGDGRSGPRICRVLREVVLDRALIDKRTIY